MLRSEARLRQILLITDGCSNIGENPVDVAVEAFRKGISVNVIGVVDGGDMGRAGRQEALSIADAGGGMCRIVEPHNVAATAQMMTHQTMQLTLQQAVSQELQSVLGKTTEELPPEERARVSQVVDKLQEELTLELVVLVDTSASMKHKMAMVREAIQDLSLSLSARLGDSQVAVVCFPSRHDGMAETIQPFTSKVDESALKRCYVASGGTPTGPALRTALTLLQQRPNEDDGARLASL
ncbi:MAG: VWA domain-containing protein [Alicyclobacillaceae bacterium]|jgi:Ca-activated chloride channel family protein|uniref:vWA domain-containing protein n=1 Tax=Alicyclobacillus sp. SP_1 TaxID=2942475 RepID=UPI002157369A|nr:VWA domain-containing protein [Alicyclobacillus sp. SP_1]MCY0887858.1 VWA domain-containing protein [Alicyclobacillaceae bacterium]MCY0896137.1 VWA domain-containing protein [Alicyclobacillaceae bacterium]